MYVCMYVCMGENKERNQTINVEEVITKNKE